MKINIQTDSCVELNQLRFDNAFVRELPADPESVNQVRQVPEACFSRVEPTAVSQPHTIACALEVAEKLNLVEQACESEQFSQIFSGNALLPNMDPFAMCYGGHQFGNWAGQLGDGRAINLGEVLNQQGERWILQLKGAGRTPYSRQGDGLAVLRSSIREFLCSEAMHHLGVPTTRALSLVSTGDMVPRDMFYDGHPKLEPGAVVCRVAPSFLRFGSFQVHAWRKEHDILKQLVDYCIGIDFPHLGPPSKEVYREWFYEVCRSTAILMVHWMRVGFVHGVMNTDNMSILGLTIDYGPYGWLEGYDPSWTPNTTDAQGRRYCFGQQAQIAHWNLAQLGNAIYPLIEEVEPLQQGLDLYKDVYQNEWCRMMADKLGLSQFDPDSDEDLVRELDRVLQLTETDMTIFYRHLASLTTDIQSDDQMLLQPLLDAFYQPEELKEEILAQIAGWLRRYQERVRRDNLTEADRARLMNRTNPKYVLRNYLAQMAIDKSEEGDHSMIHALQEVLRSPYDEQPDKEEFAQKRPEWARNRAGCSMLSCSS